MTVAIRVPTRNTLHSRVLEALAASVIPPRLSINARTDAIDPYRSLYKLHSGWNILYRMYARDWTLSLADTTPSRPLDVATIHDVASDASQADSGSDSTQTDD